jgi:hypothetical protein
LYSWWREPTSEPDAPKRMWQVATNTLNKASYQSLTRWYGIWKSSPLKELDAPVGTTGQPVRFGSDTKSNSLAQLAIYYPFWALTPSRFCSWWREPTFDPDAPKHVWQVATNTLNKVSYQSLTLQCGIWKSSRNFIPEISRLKFLLGGENVNPRKNKINK